MYKVFFNLLVTMILISSLFSCSKKTEKSEIKIAVSANFAQTAKQLIEKFQETSKANIILVKGSTGKHYAQIIHGAPYDIFFSADSATPLKLEQKQKIISKSRFTYAIGKIILWSPENRLNFSLEEIHKLKYRKFAIANPKLAPYGEAAKQSLKYVSLWLKMQGNLVFGENINQTFQFIQTGNAEMGIIAYSQFLMLPKKKQGSYWMIPQIYFKPINQQAVLLKKNIISEHFLRFLKSATAKKIIQNAGYGVLDE